MRDSTDRPEKTVVVEQEPPAGAPRHRSITEALLDNLGAWAFIALAVAALFMVWATLVIVETYVGELPGVKP